jgi:small subunit ribosomal protein S20
VPAKVVKKKNLSALKRARQAEKRNERNRMERTRIKNVMKAVETSVSAGDQDASDRSLKTAIKTIDTARLKGVIHKNNEKSEYAGKTSVCVIFPPEGLTL